MNFKDFVNIRQLSRRLNIEKSAVLKKAESGEWPSYVIGGDRVFLLEDILKLVMERYENGMKRDSNETTSDPKA